MGKYLVLWEVDRTKIPIDPKERGTGWKALMDMVKKDLERGLMKDWGGFVGENKGFTIYEGTELEVGIHLQQYVPFCFFKVHPIASMDQVDEMIQTLSG